MNEYFWHDFVSTKMYHVIQYAPDSIVSSLRCTIDEMKTLIGCNQGGFSKMMFLPAMKEEKLLLFTGFLAVVVKLSKYYTELIGGIGGNYG
jgi:hypothetical protein